MRGKKHKTLYEATVSERKFWKKQSFENKKYATHTNTHINTQMKLKGENHKSTNSNWKKNCQKMYGIFV